MITCPDCQKKFTKELNLKLHIESNNCKLKCKLCDIKFTNRPNLNRHMKNQHPPKPPDPHLIDFIQVKPLFQRIFTKQYVYDHIINPREYVETMLLQMYCRSKVSIYSETVGSKYCVIYIGGKWHQILYAHALDLMINNIVEITSALYVSDEEDDKRLESYDDIMDFYNYNYNLNNLDYCRQLLKEMRDIKPTRNISPSIKRELVNNMSKITLPTEIGSLFELRVKPLNEAPNMPMYEKRVKHRDQKKLDKKIKAAEYKAINIATYIPDYVEPYF